MFDIGWSELVVIGVVALIAIGPKELPGTLRALGHYMGKVRRMASEFQDQFREAMREAEVADLKKQFDEASEQATSAFNNPLDTVQKEMESAFAQAEEAVQEPVQAPVQAPVSEPVAEPAKQEAALAVADPGPVEPQADSKAGGA